VFLLSVVIFILFLAHINDFFGQTMTWSWRMPPFPSSYWCIKWHGHRLCYYLECALGAWCLFTKHRLLAEQWA